MKRHIEIKVIAGTVVVVHIYSDGEPPHTSLILAFWITGSLGLLGRVRDIAITQRYLRKSIFIIIIEQERILPIVAKIVAVKGRPVHFQECRIAAVVCVEVRQTVLLPAF